MKKIVLTLTAAIVCLIGFVACCNCGKQVTYGNIIGSEWKMIACCDAECDSTKADMPSFLFADSTIVGGSACCNRFMGKYSLNGDSISFEFIALTKMMCSEEAMERESAYIDVLSKGMKASISENDSVLSLTNGDITYNYQRVK